MPTHGTQTHLARSGWRPTYFADPGIVRPNQPEGGRLEDALGFESALFVPVTNGSSWFSRKDEKLLPVFWTASGVRDLLEKLYGSVESAEKDPELLLCMLGKTVGEEETVVDEGLPPPEDAHTYFLLDFSHKEKEISELCGAATKAEAETAGGGGKAKNILKAGLLTASEKMPETKSGDREAAILSIARGLAAWHRCSVFCPSCGRKTVSEKFGTCRRCAGEDGEQAEGKEEGAKAGCGRVQYPRQDPAIITLVSSGPFALLGRKPRWAAGRYSTLAGFVEIGESIEETVYREVFEEGGVSCDLSTLRFVASQPWLFPQSLMIGFHCESAKPPHTSTGESAGASSFEDKASEDVPPHMGSTAARVRERRGGKLAGVPLMSRGGGWVDLGGEGGGGRMWLPPTTIEEPDMEDVRWFHRDLVEASFSLSGFGEDGNPRFHFPGRRALARRLISDWLDSQKLQQGGGEDRAVKKQEGENSVDFE
uniref:NAD(+) diphosphatase n=1 Tax=Chromera velia CCMP2878 TaxID=1169474 RepID=A0A0G4HXW9_9ALVE|eukprot:Cvel_33329.t1-p1 / transcript=Cvel_33329.t1 / gene=Cvel_33329 / organism=Chromera_velia_CCMP2878 / gene_product=NADH pyrophosphatase, putative / transcript_product=NADH pyrophosphatase, putative / location=Cvel_scaffold5384:1016-4120(-) / protein_length=480 / sequence_SO=supercontig / SO=protein_coding / is_pseudo=false